VVTSSDTVGRLLGLSAVGPELGAIIQDLLTAGTGLEVQQRQAIPSEVGRSPNDVKGEQVIGIIRNGTLRRFYDSTASSIQTGDQLIVVRRAERPNLRDTDD
jgi:conserved domain protein